MHAKANSIDELIQSTLTFGEKLPVCIALRDSNPNDAKTWCYLGYVQGKLGSVDEAISSIGKALELQPRYLDALNTLGNILLEASRANEAVDAFEQAVALQPRHAGIINNLGRALEAQGKKGAATAQFKRAVEIDPNFSPALVNLGSASHEAMQHELALECFRRAIALDPRDPYLHVQLGTVYRNIGRYDEAYSAYQNALQLAADNVDARLGIAALLLAQGHYQECLDMIVSLPSHMQEHPTAAIMYAGLCHRFERCSDALKLVERVLRRPDLDNRSVVQLHFAAGKICDQTNDVEAAFDHYKSGNNAKTCNFEFNRTKEIFEGIKKVFTRMNLASLPHSTEASDKPVFIVGMPRSGTTLVEQIVSSHPQAFGAGELPDMSQIYSEFIREFVPGYARIHRDAITSNVLNKYAGRYLAELGSHSPKSVRITDKMPYNYSRLGVIELLLPGARVIHCTRDPMDTCLSCYFHDFQGSHDYAYNLEYLGEYYRLYADLMDHWKQHLSLPLIEVSYETLVSDTENTVRRIIDFIGLDWDDDCLEFHKNDRFVATASRHQVNRPIYNTAIGRWRRYERQLEPLRKALGDRVSRD